MIRHAPAALAALVLSAATPAAAGATERPSVDGWPSYAVGKVNVRGGGFCTATLIADDRVLTAAHCLRDHGDRWYPVGRLMVEFAPHRAERRGYAPVHSILPAPDVTFAADGSADQPARDWAILVLDQGGRRDPAVRPVGLATRSERAALGPGSFVTLMAYTPQRPFVATLAEGCRVKELRGEPEVLLHECASTVAIAGAPVFAETAAGPVLVGIQVGTGALDGEPVGVAALLKRTIEPEALLGGAGR